ncbi:MAG: ribosome-associated translation inhibitor RaiA [Bacteroides sp.]|nr:ribosome-associated translation inhibitor RaiA [Bacteroides sp.]MCM1096141.1 ribosome-associated translation inhibitor RaiA [Terasakiella sp.]
MDVRIQAIHFEISDKLTDFINKKVERIARRKPAITDVEVTLKVVKPETALNKDVTIVVMVPQHDDVVASKVADTFEEGVDLALEAVERQLEKYKDKK